MQTSQTARADEQAPEDASAAVADPKPAKRGRPPGSGKKKASKKKTSKKKKSSKKKASKKKVSKKTAGKKASKKKASNKKRTKKKATQASTGTGGMAQVLDAADRLREAVLELAKWTAAEQQKNAAELRSMARQKLEDIETAAVRTLRRLK